MLITFACAVDTYTSLLVTAAGDIQLFTGGAMDNGYAMRDGGTGCGACTERLSWPLEPGAFGTPEDEAAQPESSKPHSAAATAKDRDMENASPLLWRMRFLRMPVLRLRGPRTRFGFRVPVLRLRKARTRCAP